MIGWMALRGARRAVRSSGRAKTAVPAKSWGEISKDRTGQWAIVIFAAMFVIAVVLIGWFATYTNSH